MRRFIITLILLTTLATLMLLVCPVEAQSKSFYWESFDVAITINPDGTF